MRGNLWNFEVFYNKTSPVALYFYSFNILSEFIGNAGEKIKNPREGNLYWIKISYFPLSPKIRS